MGRFIHYEYGGEVYEHRRFMFVKWLVILLALFAVSAALPQTWQKYVNGQAPAVQLSEKPTPLVPLQPAVVTANAGDAEVIKDPELQNIIETWAKRNPSQSWGVVVESFGEDRTFAQYQPLERFYPASLYKLLITQSLSEKLPYQDWAKKKVYDYRGSHNFAACVDLMIKVSDNPCGEALGKAIGWKRVDARLKAIGLANTQLNSYDNRYTTAADMSLFLRQLHEGTILNEAAKEQVMTAMKEQKFREGIPAGSQGCTVFDKIGDLDGYKHDVALVDCGDRVYSLAILSKGGSYGQIADLAAIINQYLTELQ